MHACDDERMSTSHRSGRNEVTLRRGRFEVFRARITNGLWFVPLAATLAAWLLAWAIIRFDRGRGATAQTAWAFTGGVASAQLILTTIATAVLSFTGLVFSITIVALQLASSQFSPRVLRTFLRDRGTQVTLGVFVGTFVYTIVVLQSVREASDTGRLFVPGDAVTIGIGLVFLTVLTFVYFVHHMANGIRVVSIIESVAEETRRAIAVTYPEPVDPSDTDLGKGFERRREVARAAGARPDSPTIPSPRAGAITGIDSRALVELARGQNVVLELTCAVGDFLPGDAPMLRVYGDAPDLAVLRRAQTSVGIEPERTMDQDVAFGLRQLVDIAEKALSPAINDPTTAVQALDRIHDLLRRIGQRRLPHGILRDTNGDIRCIVPTASWDDYVALAFNEILHFGAGSVQIARRLRAAVDDLLTVVPPPRATALLSVRRALDASAERSFEDVVSRRLASTADAGGLGSDDRDEER